MPPKQTKTVHPKGSTTQNLAKAGGTNPVTSPTEAVGGHVTNYEEEQNDEIGVLKSIYTSEEYEHIDKGATAWNRKVVHAFKLHLKAPNNDSFAATLKVEFPLTYPKSPPSIDLSDVRGLQQPQKANLNVQIQKDIASLLGQVMIYEIATNVQNFLEEQAEARGADAHKPSLIEERALKVAAELQAAEAKKTQEAEAQVKAKKEHDSKVAEIERKQREEYKSKIEHHRAHLKAQSSHISDDEEEDVQQGDESIVRFDRKINVKDRAGRPCSFRRVGGMVILSEGSDTSTYIVRPIFDVGQANETALALKEFSMRDPHDNCVEGKRHIVELEEDFEKLKHLKHPNIATVFDIKIEELPRNQSDEKDHKNWKIHILMEISLKGSLFELLGTVDKLSVATIRPWTIQLIEALHQVHKSGIAHRRIHLKNVLLFRHSSNAAISVKLADTGIAYRLLTLRAHRDGTDITLKRRLPQSWLPPETANEPLGSKKTDIWDLGIVIVQMIFGLDVAEKYNSPQDLAEASQLSAPLREFLGRIFRTDANKRASPFDLLPAEFLRTDAPVLELDIPDSDILDTYPLHPTTSRRRRDSMNPPNQKSRYFSEWSDTERLGKGGFGEVVKARNKMDGNFYAIKIVKESTPAQIDEIVGEVRVLAMLNHEFVVRYYGAWMEREDGSFAESSSDGDMDYSVGLYDTKDIFRRNRTDDFISSRGQKIEFVDSEGEDDDADDDDNDNDEDTSSGSDAVLDDEEDDQSENESDAVAETDSEEESSASYPKKKAKIRGEESKSFDDAIRETFREDTGCQPDGISSYPGAPLSRLTSHETRRIPTTLYIQMEFCPNQTLRDLLEKQTLFESPDTYWLMLRQIIEGLVYVHGSGIIHRDLKPENIFISDTNKPRIGDFGLATNFDQRPATRQNTSSKLGDGDSALMTKGVGTKLYVAPEVLNKTSYSAKVDLYSLGIIFFEMCTKLGPTSFERNMEIGKLRLKDIQLPETLQTDDRKEETALIRQLLTHEPAERPSSIDLLKSHMIPLRVADENFDRAIESLNDPATGETRQALILRKLFSKDWVQADEPFFDANLTTHGLSEEALVVQMQVKEKLLSVFRRHGALEVTKQFLVPYTPYYKSEAVKFMDESGSIVQMRYDQTLPNARQLGRQIPSYPKSYSFGIVFRANEGYRGQPISRNEVAFDILSESPYDLEVKEAESIKVLDEKSFPHFSHAPMCYNISHFDILELILGYCRIKQSDRADVIYVLQRLYTSEEKWETTQHILRSPPISLPSTSINDLKLFDWREQDIDRGLKKLKSIISNNKLVDTCSSSFTHLKSIFDYMKRFAVKRKYYFTPLSMKNEHYYKGGIMFNCATDSQHNRQLLAVGGRYDALISACQPKSMADNGNIRTVGFSLALEGLVDNALDYRVNYGTKSKKKKNASEISSQVARRRCDVLVTAVNEDILRTQGIKIVSTMWASDIRAELADETIRTKGQRYVDTNYGWTLTIKQNFTLDKGVKIKNLLKGEETELSLGEVITHLISEIGDRDKKEVQAERHKVRRLSMGADIVLPSKLDESSIIIILPTERRKTQQKINRSMIFNAAQRKVLELTGGPAQVPIVVIDVKNEILEVIRATQLQGAEGWKKVMQEAPPSEKKYLTLIQERLVEMAERRKDDSRHCFVYSHRIERAIFYYHS